jgi:glutamyl/glutaminyl-tRNA synthetase
MRAAQTAAKLAPMYDRRCLQLKPDEAAAKLASGMPKVIRLKMPRDRKIEFTDRVRGRVSFLGKEIDDQVLIKSDGLPTYHLANVVDDHLMEISHVLRAEEWIASTPKHLIMYEAFGWTPPEYAHLPLILNADKSKLSKRQNDVSVESYLAKGYSPEALINFIALCGWHPGKGSEQELFTMQELIEQFSLEGVNKSGAIFNLEKLDWFNHLWSKIKFYRKLDQQALTLNSSVQITIAKNQDRTYVFADPLEAEKFAGIRAKMLLEITGLENHSFYQTDSQKFLRSLLVTEDKIIQKPSEALNLLQYFFEPKPLDNKLLMNAKMGVDTEEKALESLEFCQGILKKLEFNQPHAEETIYIDNLSQIKQVFLEAIKAANRKNGEILWPLRAALTHEEFSVGAFETVWVLGQAESIKRLAKVLKK